MIFRLTKEELLKGRPYAPNARKSGNLQSPKVTAATATSGTETLQLKDIESTSVSDSAISSSSGLESNSTVLLTSSSQPTTPLPESQSMGDLTSVQAAADSTTSLIAEFADENSRSQDGSVASSSLTLGHSTTMPNLEATATADRPPATQLPLENPEQANVGLPSIQIPTNKQTYFFSHFLIGRLS